MIVAYILIGLLICAGLTMLVGRMIHYGAHDRDEPPRYPPGDCQFPGCDCTRETGCKKPPFREPEY
jgi:hypothetical protein